MGPGPAWHPPTPTCPRYRGASHQPFLCAQPPTGLRGPNQISRSRAHILSPIPQMQGVSPNHILALIKAVEHSLQLQVTPGWDFPRG